MLAFCPCFFQPIVNLDLTVISLSEIENNIVQIDNDPKMQGPKYCFCQQFK